MLHNVTAIAYPLWLQSIADTYVWPTVAQFVDIHYIKWLLYLFSPVIIAFLVPLLMAIAIYGCALCVHLYRLRSLLVSAYESSFRDGARTTIASFWDAQGWIWHGYELIGFDNVPDTGPALIIYYHGTLPLDVYYLLAKIILHKRRKMYCVAERLLFRIPGWKLLMDVFCITPGTVDDCVEMLKEEGELLCISPGGVREALFSSNDNYELLWGKREGFAKIALNAGVPIIPMFTEGCRDVFRTPAFFRTRLRDFYERTRLPVVPIYGGFPVKMRTYLGEPIHVTAEMTPAELSEKVRESIESMIEENQRIPGSIISGICDRFRAKKLA